MITRGKQKSNAQRILIVDDIPDNIQLLARRLARTDIELVFATNGSQALLTAQNYTIDLILLDVAMPIMDGFEVCRRLKQDPATAYIPIIFLTARVQPEDILKGFELGAVDYITKPVNQSELISRVNTHLELKRAQDTIRQQNIALANTNLKLKELNSTKDKFFSIVAHDLKNPFHSLLGFSELLDFSFDELSTEEVHEMVTLIHESAQHAYSLLENLLEWSRSQAGRIEKKPENVNLKQVILETNSLLMGTAKKKNILLNDDVDESIFLFVDINMLKTIIRNLVFNSLKFTAEGGSVKVSAQVQSNQVEITISDTGIGMTKEDIEKLFRIDVYHTTTGTGKEKGTALGLLICKEFVENCGGSIWAESEYGKGSDFKFTIPIAVPDTDTISAEMRGDSLSSEHIENKTAEQTTHVFVLQPNESSVYAKQYVLHLVKQVLPLWQEVVENKYINQVVIFCQELKRVARQYDQSDIMRYANELVQTANSFKLKQIDELIYQFPTYVIKLATLAKLSDEELDLVLKFQKYRPEVTT